MSGVHQLVSLRSYFYLGLYDQVISEAKSLGSLSGAAETARLAYVYRAHVAMGNHAIAAKEITKKSPTVLQVVQLHSTYLTAHENNKQMALEKLNEMVEDGSMAQDQLFLVVAAEMYLSGGELKEALKLVSNGTTLDMMGLTVQILLSIDRADLAQQHLKKMVEVDEDDTLTQLATAWVNVVQGGSKWSEALDTYQDLQEKFGSSILLLNSIAVCQIHQKLYSEALSTLGAARDLALKMKIKINTDTYINTMICLHHMRKAPEAIQRIMSDFQKTAPGHPWIKKQTEMRKAIEKSKKAYS
uniref:Coatomer subunit epsilon n=1 Tax=Lotharella oceanica TaxID=641309 RepID=A0A7S2XA61_9EUKA|mmetsp:Transcript_24080/g.45011  ORF Transcript_24080/g.45011 Transcript_24080/m.45011 type:complete len:300 (+) Transcript_24080:39-938(+)